MNTKAQKFQPTNLLQGEEMKLISVNTEQLKRLNNQFQVISSITEALTMALQKEPIGQTLIDIDSRLADISINIQYLLKTLQMKNKIETSKIKSIKVDKELLEMIIRELHDIKQKVKESVSVHEDAPIKNAFSNIYERLEDVTDGFKQLLEASQNTEKIYTKYAQNKETDMRIKPETYQDLDGMRIIVEQLSSLTYYLTTHDEVDKEIAPTLRHIHAHLHKLSENMQAVLNEIEEASLEAIDEA